MKKYICEPCGYEYDPEVGGQWNCSGNCIRGLARRLVMSDMRSWKRRFCSRRLII